MRKYPATMTTPITTAARINHCQNAPCAYTATSLSAAPIAAPKSNVDKIVRLARSLDTADSVTAQLPDSQPSVFISAAVSSLASVGTGKLRHRPIDEGGCFRAHIRLPLRQHACKRFSLACVQLRDDRADQQ